MRQAALPGRRYRSIRRRSPPRADRSATARTRRRRFRPTRGGPLSRLRVLARIGVALAAFERSDSRRYRPGQTVRLLRRVCDDVAQTMRETFLIRRMAGQSDRGVSGRGALSNWIRVIAIGPRSASAGTAREGTRPSARPKRALLERRSRAGLPEGRYVGLREALQAALAGCLTGRAPPQAPLPGRVSIDRIGALYGIHRSTVARWRSSIAKHPASTREQLRRRLA